MPVSCNVSDPIMKGFIGKSPPTYAFPHGSALTPFMSLPPLAKANPHNTFPSASYFTINKGQSPGGGVRVREPKVMVGPEINPDTNTLPLTPALTPQPTSQAIPLELLDQSKFPQVSYFTRKTPPVPVSVAEPKVMEEPV